MHLPNHDGWHSKYLILESGCLASCVELAFFRWRPPEFLHGPMSLLSKDWFACDVNLCKYLCHSPNGFAHNTGTLRNYLSRKTQRDTFYQWKWILYIIVDSKPAENLIWDVLLFWLPNIERYFKHWASCLSRKRKLDDQRKKIKAPNVLPLATKEN